MARKSVHDTSKSRHVRPLSVVAVKRSHLGVLLTHHFLVVAVNPARVIFSNPTRLLSFDQNTRLFRLTSTLLVPPISRAQFFTSVMVSQRFSEAPWQSPVSSRSPVTARPPRASPARLHHAAHHPSKVEADTCLVPPRGAGGASGGCLVLARGACGAGALQAGRKSRGISFHAGPPPPPQARRTSLPAVGKAPRLSRRVYSNYFWEVWTV